MILYDIDAPENRGRRPPKERDVEILTTSSVGETEDKGKEKSLADDDSAEINQLGSYRRDY